MHCVCSCQSYRSTQPSHERFGSGDLTEDVAVRAESPLGYDMDHRPSLHCCWGRGADSFDGAQGGPGVDPASRAFHGEGGGGGWP